MRREQFKEYQRIRGKYFACEGVQIHKKMERLNVSYCIFCGNYHELMRALNEYRDPAKSLHLQGVENQQDFFLFLDELLRFLFNFVAAAMSLKDHTSRMINKLYDGHPFRNEYQKKVDQVFALSPVAGFIQDLRNYVLHLDVPDVFAIHYFESGSYDARICLNREHLLKSGDWKPRTRTYLETSPEEIDLIVPVQDYCFLVLEFHDWLQDRQLQLHEPELAEMNSLQEHAVKMEQEDV